MLLVARRLSGMPPYDVSERDWADAFASCINAACPEDRVPC